MVKVNVAEFRELTLRGVSQWQEVVLAFVANFYPEYLEKKGYINIEECINEVALLHFSQFLAFCAIIHTFLAKGAGDSRYFFEIISSGKWPLLVSLANNEDALQEALMRIFPEVAVSDKNPDFEKYSDLVDGLDCDTYIYLVTIYVYLDELRAPSRSRRGEYLM